MNGKLKKIILIAIICVIVILSALLIIIGNEKRKDTKISSQQGQLDYAGAKNPIVTLDIEDLGRIDVELYLSAVPNSVENFLSLVSNDFYDGAKFNKKGDDFVQVGYFEKYDQKNAKVIDLTKANNQNEYFIKGDFKENSFENPVEIKKGTLCYVRDEKDFNSASFQFFICTKDTKNYDGKYAAFGCIQNGFEILEQIDEKLEKDSTIPILEKGTIEQENGGVKIKEAKVTFCDIYIETPNITEIKLDDKKDEYDWTTDYENIHVPVANEGEE